MINAFLFLPYFSIYEGRKGDALIAKNRQNPTYFINIMDILTAALFGPS